MTATVQTTNLIGAGTQITLAAAGDSLFLPKSVLVASTGNNWTVNAAHGDHTLLIEGTVASAGSASAIVVNGGDNVVSIGRTGVVRSADVLNANFALNAFGGNSSIVNNGLIAGERGGGVIANFGGNDITNNGIIIGANGVFLNLSGLYDQLTNSGQIIATDVNPAGGGRYDHAVHSDNTTNIVNLSTGEIIAHSELGAGVSIGYEGLTVGGGSSVINHGSITSVQFWGVDFAKMPSDRSATLQNFGIIQGGTGSFLGADSGEDVLNSGLMIGDIKLGGGADKFDGRGGTVIGNVIGGTGNDSYFVDDTALSLVEASLGGSDTVYSEVNWLLGLNFENLTLLGADDINGTGNTLDNTLAGNAGDNVLNGRGGIDTVNGEDGDDTLRGGAGDDTLNGGSGDDELRGQIGIDTLNGEEGNDILRGGAGNDTLNGDDGDDILWGGAGSDQMYGGAGDDILLSGANGDNMWGEAGSDTFRFLRTSDSPDTGVGWQADRIYDFLRGEDLIDLQAVVPGTLEFINASAFSATGQAEVRTTDDGNGAREVRVDVDGDGTADMWIRVLNIFHLNEHDFIL